MKSLKSFLDASFINSNSWQFKLASQWSCLVGNLANIMSLEKIYGTTIIVGVYEQSWMHELYMLSSMIIKTINENLEGSKIDKIQFKLATRKKNIESKKMNISQINTMVVSLNKQEELALSCIKDVELRQSLQLFLMSCKKRNEYEKK